MEIKIRFLSKHIYAGKINETVKNWYYNDTLD